MQLIAVAGEGPTDLAAAAKILASRGLRTDPRKLFSRNGKAGLDPKISSYNNAARFGPWLILRDADQDAGDCPVRLRNGLIPPSMQSPSLCLRIPVRALEAWLLADTESFSQSFSVSVAALPPQPEKLDNPKIALVQACRKSRSAAIRRAMVPPQKSVGHVGPEYTTYLIDYCINAWRPEVAAAVAPSLARALRDIDRLICEKIWA